MDQINQIKLAKKAYIVRLNDPKDAMSKHRYAIYLDREDSEGLRVLWPFDCGEGKKAKDLLEYQVYTSKRSYPAFHFALGGCGYSKPHSLAQSLRRINPSIVVYEPLSGHQCFEVSK